MLVRTLPQAVAVCASSCVIALASVAVAVADPNPQITPGNVTAGTDVAAPDQQNPTAAPAKPVAQPAPTWPQNPQTLTPPRTVSASAGGGFQWGDAGIGAGGALVIVLTGFGAAAIVRRRNAQDGPLPA